MSNLAKSRTLCRLPIAIVVFFASSLWFVGCGSDEETKSCDDDDSPSVPSLSAKALIRGQLKLETRTSFDVDGTETKMKNIATAFFVDNTRVERVTRSTDIQKFSTTCSGLTGSPTDKCREPHTENCVPLKVDVEKVQVEGVPEGLTLEKRGEGNFGNVDAPDPLYGTEDITATVTGKDEEGFFPSFELTVAPPDELIVEKPLSTETVGTRDLEICWKGRNGNLMEIDVSISRADGSTEDTDKVVCIVNDDGCHVIPVGAFDWLRLGDMKSNDQFKLTLVRQKIAVQEIDDQTGAEIKVTRRVEMVLAQDDV